MYVKNQILGLFLLLGFHVFPKDLLEVFGLKKLGSWYLDVICVVRILSILVVSY